MKNCLRHALAVLVLTAAGVSLAEAPARIEAGTFRSVLPPSEEVKEVTVNAFALAREPVTNREFLAFAVRHPGWRRGEVASLFADENYLAHWSGPLTLGEAALPEQPVTNVSWFAARAYCDAGGGRLPTWHEWEYVAAADEAVYDARDNPEWRQQILSWYGQTGGKSLARVAGRRPNAWGVHDMHGLVWEWVDDFNALLVSSDNREQDGADKLRFCGAGAATMEEKENYATLMRTAMLSSLSGRDTTRNLGFRCAYAPEEN